MRYSGEVHIALEATGAGVLPVGSRNFQSSAPAPGLSLRDVTNPFQGGPVMWLHYRIVVQRGCPQWLVPFDCIEPYISHLQVPPNTDAHPFERGPVMWLYYRIVVQSGWLQWLVPFSGMKPYPNYSHPL